MCVCVIASQQLSLVVCQHFVIILLFPSVVAVITTSHIDDMFHCLIVTGPQSRSLESQMAGLQSLWLAYGDCLEVKREYYQNCSVLGCVTQCSQLAAHSYEQFLQVQQIEFVTLGPLRHA